MKDVMQAVIAMALVVCFAVLTGWVVLHDTPADPSQITIVLVTAWVSAFSVGYGFYLGSAAKTKPDPPPQADPQP